MYRAGAAEEELRHWAGDEAADGTTYAERSAMHLLDEAEERHAQVRRLNEPSVCPDHP